MVDLMSCESGRVNVLKKGISKSKSSSISKLIRAKHLFGINAE